MVQVAIFASGSGSNAENIIRYFANDENIEIKVVLSNNKNAYVHTRAKNLGVPSFTFTKSEFEQGDLIVETLKEYNVDFIVLSGFMLKITLPVLEAWRGRIVNIHPALLPKFGGKGMYGEYVHKAVVEAGEKESGITIHHVNEHYDEGAIIFQSTCPILPGDSPDDVAQKVHALEYAHYPRVIEAVINRMGLGVG